MSTCRRRVPRSVECAAGLRLPALAHDSSCAEQAQAFIDALTHVESTLVGECTSAKEAAGRRVGDLERRVNRCAEALSDAVQQERVEQREREHIEKAIADLDVELAVARRQTVALEPLRAQLREAERALQDHVAQVAALDVDKQLECLTRQQSSLMPRIDAAVTRIQTLQRAADARSAVSVQERLLDQARRRASEARAKCPPMDGLSAQDMADRLAREHAEARAASDRARANVHSAQESKSLLHGRRQALQAQVADAEQRARDLRARVDAHRVSSRAHLDELVAARTAEQARHEQTVRSVGGARLLHGPGPASHGLRAAAGTRATTRKCSPTGATTPAPRSRTMPPRRSTRAACARARSRPLSCAPSSTATTRASPN